MALARKNLQHDVAAVSAESQAEGNAVQQTSNAKGSPTGEWAAQVCVCLFFVCICLRVCMCVFVFARVCMRVLVCNCVL